MRNQIPSQPQQPSIAEMRSIPTDCNAGSAANSETQIRKNPYAGVLVAVADRLELLPSIAMTASVNRPRCDSATNRAQTWRIPLPLSLKSAIVQTLQDEGFRAPATGDSLQPSRLILDNQRRPAMGDDKKRSGDRRTMKERRSGIDTRSEEEKRLAGERRSQVDRRSGQDRRAKRSETPKTK